MNALESVCVPPTNVYGRLTALTRLVWRKPTEPATKVKYGTRCSTVVLVDASGRMKVVERSLGDDVEAGMRNAERTTIEFGGV